MGITLSHAGPVGLFTLSVTHLAQRFPVNFIAMLVRCSGVVGHVEPSPYLFVCLYETDGS